MAFRGLRLVPAGTNFNFIGQRYIAFALTALLLLVTIVALPTRGLNFGIDFVGGTVIEIASPQPIDVGAIRQATGGLELGQVSVQEFGSPNNVMIRVQAQASEAEDAAAVLKVRNALGTGYEYRRVERVGPKVGSELLQDGIIATLLAIAGIGIYVYFRFEWQFALAALFATFHDVAVTVGLFSILQLEFDLTAIAALLTLAGYSVNDTVVVFDRIRETMRRHKTMEIKQLINLSVNQTLSRTTMTSLTTLMAILPLLLFGGSSLLNFTVAMTWGILIGTYSSIFMAAALLIYLPPVRDNEPTEEKAGGVPAPR